MNMLLHSPGILLVLLASCGLHETIFCLSLCAIVQIVAGYPFLSTFPYEYISKAFELGRVFMFKWTVNFKFLPESVFVSKELSILLLVLTVVGYIVFAVKWIREVRDIV
jgi:alpha-1,3-mannosyltransferase